MEERSLPRYQQGMPVMSKFEKVCRVKNLHESGGFLLSYDKLQDVTKYPTYPENPPRWDVKWCKNGEVVDRVLDLKDPGSGYWVSGINYIDDEIVKHQVCKYPNVSLKQCQKLGAGSVISIPNMDSSKGAVKAWGIASMSMDGLNWRSLVTSVNATLVEGDKTPLGGVFQGRFNSADEFNGLNEKIIINGQEWEYWQQIPRPYERGDSLNKKGELSGASELYKTKIGGYTLFVLGDLPPQITRNPDWFAKRRVFLRQWVETFKIEPLPTDYKKVP